MSFEKASSAQLVGKRFRLGDGDVITISKADDLDVRYLERSVWFRRDTHDLPNSGDGRCLLTYIESLVEIENNQKMA